MQGVYQADPKKIIIGMVGLPARGKSYISKKVQRFLKWLGFNAKVFNIGNYRREYMKENGIQFKQEYFNNNDPNCKKQREEIATLAMMDLIQYIKSDGQIAILDGTNSNIERRKNFKQLLAQQLNHIGYSLMWIESICNDPKVIERNITNVKVFSPDYENKPSSEVVGDFMKRIGLYQSAYQPIQKDQGLQYIKTINIGREFEICQIRGYLQQKICTFVMNINICPERIIYLLRHGETLYNTDNRIGGNPGLTEDGKIFSRMLNQFFKEQSIPESQKIILLTSTMKRAIDTAEQIKINDHKPIQLKVLDELNAGLCENMSYSQVQEKYPILFKQRNQDKLRFRYPKGESYLDLISRLQPLVNWIERQAVPIIVVAHQAVLRCLYAYFFKTEVCQLPYLRMQLHTIIKLIPETYFFNQIVYQLDTNEQRVANTIEKKSQPPKENKKMRKIKSEFVGMNFKKS